MNQTVLPGQVVVGIDGSTPSKRALEWAAFIARNTGAEIVAVTAWHLPLYGPAEWPLDWDPETEAGNTLRQTVGDVLGPDAGVTVRELVMQGDAAQILLDASTDAQALVVGSRGHGGFTGLLLGSVSRACVEHAMCPVVVIHGQTRLPSSQQAGILPGAANRDLRPLPVDAVDVTLSPSQH